MADEDHSLDLTGLGKVADSQLANKLYDDLLHKAASELGLSAHEFVKTFRLLTFPFQFLAAWQDRLAVFCDRIRNRVPPERQQEASASIAGPVLFKLCLMEENNPLTELYLNLLARAIDKERCNEAHPAFARIIDQLSPDEAMVIYLLATKRAWRWPYDTTKDHSTPRFPIDRLSSPDTFSTYVDHLISLGLMPQHELHQRMEDGQYHFWRYSTSLNGFGKMFAQACIPEDFKLNDPNPANETNA